MQQSIQRRYSYLYLDKQQRTIGLAGTGSGNIPSFTATNTGTTPVVSTIIVTPHFANGGITCDGPTKTFTITVNPTAQVNQPLSEVLCNGAPTTAVNYATVNTAAVQLPIPGQTATAPSDLAGTGSGNIPSFTATNTGHHL